MIIRLKSINLCELPLRNFNHRILTKKQATKNLYYVSIEIPTHQQIKAIVNIFSLHWLNVKIIFVLFFDISIFESEAEEERERVLTNLNFLHAISSRPTKFDKNNQNKPSQIVQSFYSNSLEIK